MNNIFQFDRFFKLIARGLVHRSKVIMLAAIGFMGLSLVIFLTNVLNGNEFFSLNFRANTLSTTLIFMFIFSPFIFFFSVNHPKKGLTEVMLPASALEKYLVMQFFCIIIAPFLTLLFYGSIDALLATLFPRLFRGYAFVEIYNFSDFNWESYMIFFLMQQVFMFFNLYFVNHKLLKTFGSVMLLQIAFIILFLLSIKLVVPEVFEGDTGLKMNIKIPNGDSLLIQKGSHSAIVLEKIFRIFIDIVAPIALIFGSYFKLKTNRY
ncbi:MAG TPA: hypothetical protein DCF46_03970 [Porphyromonadaceae bacterium]|nr:hypothetical protein [Porphyromonadaceae bacterium]HBU45584.1 hypothetical protein [Porphyromonadaceae bacterium]